MVAEEGGSHQEGALAFHNLYSLVLHIDSNVTFQSIRNVLPVITFCPEIVHILRLPSFPQ